MRLNRAELLSSALLATLPTRPPAAWAEVFYQADDKSWDLTLPDTWTLERSISPRDDPAHFYHVTATRPGSTSAQLDVVVDITGKKTLKDLGKLDAVAQRYLSQQPQPSSLVKAVEVPRPGPFSTNSYELRYAVAGNTRTTGVKVSAKQGRVYQLTLSIPFDSPTPIQQEFDSILGSFRAFPLNAGCLAQSNRGGAIIPGVCY